MLKVKTYISYSKIHGKGLFAMSFIPKGTVVWEYSDRELFDTPIPDLEKYGWFDTIKQKYCYPMDSARWINHNGKNANLEEKGDTMIAKRDINVEDEITENYYDYMNEEDAKRHLRLLNGDTKKKKGV